MTWAKRDEKNLQRKKGHYKCKQTHPQYFTAAQTKPTKTTPPTATSVSSSTDDNPDQPCSSQSIEKNQTSKYTPSCENTKILRSFASDDNVVQSQVLPDNDDAQSQVSFDEDLAESEDLEDSYFVVNAGMLQILLNTVARSAHSTECKNKDLKLKLREQRLLSTSFSVHCKGCNFQCEPHKMYREVIPDDDWCSRPLSTLNRAFAAALIGSSIQGTQIFEIFLTIGLDAGSVKSINLACQRASNLIHGLGIENLDDVRSRMERLGREVHLLFDCMYNNPNKSDGSTPYQKASIRYSLAIDSETHQIAAADIANKNCRRASHLMRRNERPDCPNHADNSKCTATMPQDSSIGNEAASIMNIAAKMRESNVTVTEVTSDADSTVDGAIKEGFGPGTKHTYDFVHKKRNLVSSLRNQIMGKIRDDAFPGPESDSKSDDAPSTSKDSSIKARLRPKAKEGPSARKKRVFPQFCADLARRVDADISHHFRIIQKATPEGEEFDFEALSKQLEKVPTTAIKCVAGIECGIDCLETSAGCIGQHPKHKFYSHGEGKIDFNSEEIEWIKKMVVDKKTSLAALKSSNPKTKTQVSESQNKRLTKTNPKSMNFTATSDGRVHRSILTNNLGSYEATMRILQAIGHDVSARVKEKLQTHQELDSLRKRLHRSFEYRHARTVSRAVKHQMHAEGKTKGVVDYQKGIEFD